MRFRKEEQPDRRHVRFAAARQGTNSARGRDGHPQVENLCYTGGAPRVGPDTDHHAPSTERIAAPQACEITAVFGPFYPDNEPNMNQMSVGAVLAARRQQHARDSFTPVLQVTWTPSDGFRRRPTACQRCNATVVSYLQGPASQTKGARIWTYSSGHRH